MKIDYINVSYNVCEKYVVQEINYVRDVQYLYRSDLWS